jgi:hypothetical protein
MRFQPGQSGNPAGRPAGSLNKKTLALEDAFAGHAEEIVANVMDRAKAGEPAAMRMCMERLVPTGRNRPLAIDLPAIETPDDARAALAVVTAELAAGNLTIAEASSLVTLVDRMLRLAERIWKFETARRDAARREAILFPAAEGQEAAEAAEAPEGDAEAAQTTAEPGAPLHFPVNSDAAGVAGESGRKAADTPRRSTPSPLANAA